MKTPGFLKLILCLSLAVLCSSARATITVLDYYRLGEDDPGATNNGFAFGTRDSAGTNDLVASPGLPATWYNYVSAAASNHTASVFSCYFGGNPFYGPALTNLTDNFGIEAWVYPSVTGSTNCIVYNGTPGADGWGLWQVGNFFQGCFGGVEFFGLGAGSFGSWTHLALVCDDGLARLYVNGVPSGTELDYLPNTPSDFFGIGGTPDNAPSEFFNGLVDEVRVFTFAPGQFSSGDLLVNSPLPPPTILAESATNVTGANATLITTVDPRGQSTSVYFQYGTTTNYGSFTPTNSIPAASPSGQAR